MSDNQGNTFLNNIIFVVLIVFLTIGAIKNFDGEFSRDTVMNVMLGQKQNQPQANENVFEEENNIFNTVQEERVRHKIDYSTAQQFLNQRSLTGTEIQELENHQSISSYFVRNSSKKLIFYPTTGTDEISQQFMRDFTKLRTSLKYRNDLIFIPVETGLISNTAQMKNSSDRVLYNLRKECGKFCIINVSTNTITSLKSPAIGMKTFEVVEAVINSL